MKRLVPRDKKIRLVAKMSNNDFLLLYENHDLASPDPHILFFKNGELSSEFDMNSLPSPFKRDADWRKSFGGYQYARVCDKGETFLYLSFQAGNAGGFFVGVLRSGGRMSVVPLADVAQSRMVVSSAEPSAVEIWDVAPKDRLECTGCRKHYLVTTYHLDAGTKTTVSKRTTTRTYDGDEFQNHPLVVGKLDQ